VKANKTKDENDALRTWASNKINPKAKKQYEDIDIYNPITTIPNSTSISVPAKDQYDLNTGKRADKSTATGEQTYTKINIEYMPYNKSEDRIGKKQEYGSYNSLNEGWDIVPFIVGHDVDGKETYAKKATPADVKQIEDKTNTHKKVIDLSSVKYTHGTTKPTAQAKQSKVTPEQTATGQNGAKMYKYKGKWYTQQEFDKL
jgi:hypothetical protein